MFREDPKSPNVLISLVFLGAVLATLPVLLGAVCLCPRTLPISLKLFLPLLLSTTNHGHRKSGST